MQSGHNLDSTMHPYDHFCPRSDMDRLSPLQEAIGHLCTEFAKLETVIGCAVGFMANPTEARIGHILVAELSFKARLAAFSNLYAERAQPGFDDAPLRSFLSEIGHGSFIAIAGSHWSPLHGVRQIGDRHWMCRWLYGQSYRGPDRPHPCR